MTTEPQTQHDEPTYAAAGFTTAGASGGVLAAIAQQLPDPYRFWLSIASPILAGAVATAWPWVVAIVRAYFYKKRLQQFVTEQDGRIDNGGLSDEEITRIKARIDWAQSRITDTAFGLIQKTELMAGTPTSDATVAPEQTDAS